MPYARPTLSDLRNQVAQDIASALPGAEALLRFSNLKITGDAQAFLAHLHYGYLDWIARQSVPFTATDEFLEGWAALKGVFRTPASQASGAVTFSGAPGSVIPTGAPVVRGDGATFTVQGSAAIGIGGTVAVAVTADSDPAGISGAAGNTAVGAAMTLGQAIAGVQSSGVASTALTGGADIEADDSLRSRMLAAYQSPPEGGDQSDYVKWARAVPGVTRAWCAPNGFGAGTVVVYIMLDISRATNGGFPEGADGVAADEGRAVAATGDQLVVANHILPIQPVTALVYVAAPTANPVAFTIKGIPSAAKSLIPAAISGVFLRDGTPGGTVPIAHVWSAIAAVSGVDDFVVVSPAADIANPAGALPTVGAITYT